jgi:hypothetical protein
VIQFDIDSFVKGLIRKSITRSFLTSIQILEEIKSDGRLGDDEFQILRKRILDSGNGAIREVAESIDQFELVIKKQNK